MDLSGELEIRFAAAEDEPALGRIDIETRDPANTPAPDPPPGRRFFGRPAGPADTLVATVAGEPVGLIALRPPTALESNAHVLEVCEFAVLAAHRGRGIGAALLEAGVDEARSRGARRLTLRVLSTNPGARRLYEAAGFELEGVLRGEFLLEGEYVDDLLMARDLA